MFNEKLYSISDIAKMTKLTDRTIRNYLAKGNLKGVKVGGQWRFTKEDVKALFSNDKFEDDMKNKTENTIVNFFNSANYENKVCAIFKFSLKHMSREERSAFYAKSKEIREKENIKEKISFVDDNGNTTMVIVSTPEQISQISDLIKEV